MIKLKNFVRANILGLEPYSSARDEFAGKEGIFMDANENPFGEINRYPDPYQKELKTKLAKLKGIVSNKIFIGNGSDEIIDLAFRIFCSPGIDKALTFTPTYGMYDVSAAINDIKLIKTPLDLKFQIDLESLTRYFSDPSIKLIFICSPNNPTGNLMKKQDIEFILNRFNGIVIIDEAYIDFAPEDSLIQLVNQYNNLIVSQTFSKAWGLAGARIGSAYSNEEIIKLFNKIKPPYNVSSINQQAAINALDNYQAYKERLLIILSEKQRLITELKKFNVIKTIHPSDTNFILLKVNDSTHLYNSLIKHKIITRNRHTQLENCLRLTIGTPEENNELLDVLKNYDEENIIY